MESFILILNQHVVGICHILAMLVISIGIIKAMLIFFKDILFHKDSKSAIQESRTELGHSFSLGLGFLIGASILRTTLTPSWDDIGQLATIIGIRTALNYFLLAEIAKFSTTNNNQKDCPDKKTDSQKEISVQ
jgi:uncharacterized membrane protein